MTPSLRTFNERLLHSCAELSPDEAAALRAKYGLLREGEPIVPATLAATAGLSLAALNDLVLHRPGVARFGADGRIHGYPDLSIEPTAHSLDMDGRRLLDLVRLGRSLRSARAGHTGAP
jgi:hypothetical protein